MWFQSFEKGKVILNLQDELNVTQKEFESAVEELAQKSEESNQLYQSLKALNEKLQTHENEKVDFLKQVRLWNFLKSYLHYKMITSQNMLSEVQIKHF